MSLAASPSISDLNDRSREIFRLIVDAYVGTGEPVGSRTVSRLLTNSLSPATIRNVMADLQDIGLLSAPHTSAGRVPTAAGLRVFVNGLLQVGTLSQDDRLDIEARCSVTGRGVSDLLDTASDLLSGLSSHAGLVVAPTRSAALKHIEFVPIAGSRALVVLVDESGHVENRVVDVPAGLPATALVEATNYLQSRLTGRTLNETRGAILSDIEAHRAQLDDLAADVVQRGLGVWAGEQRTGTLIVKGQSRLLDDVQAVGDLERLRGLFDALETKETLLKLVDAAEGGQGVQIFIGAENDLFSHAGWSMVLAPYGNSEEKVLGAIGVIGPTRLNYARIIPMVDYTARVVGRLLG